MNDFAIRCHNKKEFEFAQKYLFSKGFQWRDSCKKIICVDYFPIVITPDVFNKNEKLIYHDDYNVSDYDNNGYFYDSKSFKYFKFININVLLRKQKLNKINNECL